MTATLTLGSVALGLARSGFEVHPLRPGAKVPATRDGLKSATRNPKRIRAWWGLHPNLNIGIHCGRSNLVVIDCDNGKPWPLDEPQPAGIHNGMDVLQALVGDRINLDDHPSVLTPSGGMHYYFRAPAGVEIGNSAGLLGPWIDVRAGEGYVVAPWSNTAAGDYSVFRHWPFRVDASGSFLGDSIDAHGPATLTEVRADVQDLPDVLLDKVRKRTRAPMEPLDSVLQQLRAPKISGGYGPKALASEIEKVRSAREGTRNHTLNAAAFAMGQLVAAGLLDEDDVVSQLLNVGREIGLEDAEMIGAGNRWGTIGSGLAAGKRSPREIGVA